MIVVMMSGEEMLADQVELPHSSNGHWGMNTSCGVDDPPHTDICYGQSFWLYGAQLQRDQLRSDQLAMKNDTRTLFMLRAAHADVLHTDLCKTQLLAIPTGEVVGYAPYSARFSIEFVTLEDAIGSHACSLEALACVRPMAFLSSVHSSYRLPL
jgi:hypothetical protein